MLVIFLSDAVSLSLDSRKLSPLDILITPYSWFRNDCRHLALLWGLSFAMKVTSRGKLIVSLRALLKIYLFSVGKSSNYRVNKVGACGIGTKVTWSNLVLCHCPMKWFLSVVEESSKNHFFGTSCVIFIFLLK